MLRNRASVVNNVMSHDKGQHITTEGYPLKAYYKDYGYGIANSSKSSYYELLIVAITSICSDIAV